MKKLLVALPIIAGTSWAGSSFYAGVQSETAYDHFLSQAQLMQPISFERESFEKGLTTSHAVTVVRESNGSDGEILFRLKHDINHSTVQLNDAGPAIGTAIIRTTLVENSVNAKYETLHSYFTGSEALEILTKAGINGHIASDITISPMEFPALEGEATASIAETMLRLSNEGDRTMGDGQIGAVTLKSERGGLLTTSPLAIELDIATQKPLLSSNTMTLTMDQLVLESPDISAPLQAKDVRVEASSLLNDGDLDYLALLHVGEANFDSLAPTGSSAITAGKFEMGINNINLESLDNYYQYMSPLSIAKQTDPSVVFTPEFLNEYVKLATKNVELTYLLDLENSAGSADADITLRFIGDESQTGRDNIVTVGDLLNATEIHANARMDKAALELTPAADLMNTLPAQIAFVEDNNRYTAEVSLKKLEADLNGDVFPLGQMGGEILTTPLTTFVETFRGLQGL